MSDFKVLALVKKLAYPVIGHGKHSLAVKSTEGEHLCWHERGEHKPTPCHWGAIEDKGKVNASGRSPKERGRVAESIPSVQWQRKACRWVWVDMRSLRMCVTERLRGCDPRRPFCLNCLKVEVPKPPGQVHPCEAANLVLHNKELKYEPSAVRSAFPHWTPTDWAFLSLHVYIHLILLNLSTEDYLDPGLGKM